MTWRLPAASLLIAAAACSSPQEANRTEAGPAPDPIDEAAPPPANQAAAPPANPSPAPADAEAEPVAPGDAAPPADRSAEAAAEVVRTYYALIGAGRFAEARRLWSSGGAASDRDAAVLAARFRGVRALEAEVGAPGRIEGAAGSLYVAVPVVLEGRLADGTPFRRTGTVTLRRVNDVPGSTEAQRRWHIARNTLEPPG